MDIENLEQVRPLFVQMMTEANKPLRRSSVKATSMEVAGPIDNDLVPVIVYTPKSAGTRLRPGLLHMHGGGFISGNAEMNSGYCQSLAEDIGCIVVSVDYRLAPEHPFPAGLEDCYAALKWLFKSAESLGVDPHRIAITGESAGGGLAAQLAILARDRGEYNIVFQALTFPMLDNRTGISMDPGKNVGQDIWTKQNNKFSWNSYLKENKSFQSQLPPYPSSPARIENLKGLAPAFVAVGDQDLLAKECAVYAERLTKQGVPAELHIYRDAVHGFNTALGTPTYQAFTRDINLALQRAFGLKAEHSSNQGESHVYTN